MLCGVCQDEMQSLVFSDRMNQNILQSSDGIFLSSDDLFFFFFFLTTSFSFIR